jgi:two-component system, NarL family, sensor kinase
VQYGKQYSIWIDLKSTVVIYPVLNYFYCMRVAFLALWLFCFTYSYASDGYITAVQQQVANAATDGQKMAAYEKWLPLSILIHRPNAKNDLDSFKLLVEKKQSALGNGIYNLNMAYYVVENYGDYNKGLELCLKAKDIFESLNAKPQLIMTYNRLAFLVLWNQIGKKNTLLKENLNDKYLSKALTFSKELKDNNLEIITLGFIGSYYNVTENNNQKALSYFFNAEKLLTDTTTPDTKLVILESIAIVYADMFREQDMLTYLGKCEALPFFQTFGYGQSNMYRAVARMYLSSPFNKDLDKALAFANKAYTISLQMGAPEYITQGEQRLFEIYKAMGNEKMALQFHEKYKQHEDSLSRERFQRTYTEYDVVKKEATIQTLENDKLKEKNKRNNLIGSVLLFSLFAGIAFSIYVYRNNNKLKNKNTELLQKNAEIEKALIKGQTIERKRVAADLHDTLGVQANAILHNTTLLKTDDTDKESRIDFLHETAKEMLLNLRETLWAMKANDIAAVDVWLRIVNFCQQMGRHYKTIQITTEGETATNTMLESPRALNVVMIVQEAVNNAIKHAGAPAIKITSSLQNKVWQISIADNGKGFNEKEAAAKTDSYGLTNMKERAAAANINLHINSSAQNGTAIQLQIV